MYIYIFIYLFINIYVRANLTISLSSCAILYFAADAVMLSGESLSF